MNARAYAAGFNFRGADQQKKVGTSPAASATGSTWPSCSRAAATCCCWTSRPTTSTWTRSRALEEALLGFAGCAVVISHDRWFLDRIATHILAFEGNSEVVWFEGNYQEYAADYTSAKGASTPTSRTGSGTRSWCIEATA